MVEAVAVLFPAAVIAIALVALGAARHRLLALMAYRNALRRPRLTAMVVAGLMVGTAIVSSAFVASDSLDRSIREATYESFGEIDETVYAEGFSFFPEYVADELAADADLMAVADAVAPQAIWDGSVVNQRTDLYEPTVRMIGFDPERDDGFGPFLDGEQEFWGRDLGDRDVILVDSMAEALDARVGDELVLNYSRPLDPVLPEVRQFSGQVTGGGSGLPVVGAPDEAAYTADFGVEANALGLIVVVAWPDGAQDLDVTVSSPTGGTVSDQGGETGEPDTPVVLNVTGSLVEPVPTGQWEVRVDAKAAANQAFQGWFITLYAEYDLSKILEREQEFENASLPFELEDVGQVERLSVLLRVAAVSDGGKGLQFLDPNTLFMRLDALQQILDRPGQVNIVRVSNPGGVRDGPDTAPVVYPELWSALNRSKQAHPDQAAVQALKADNDKVFWLSVADSSGELFGLFLGFVSSFAVIAGLLLILNIFTMLADERKRELAISRALGLRRRDLVRLFVYEGTMYAVVAAVLGTLAGLALAWAMVWGFNNVFSGTFGLPQIPFFVDVRSLLLAFALGVALTLATVWVAARRSSRLNIVRAIRELEEPEILRGGWTVWAALALMAVGLVASIWGLAVNSFAGQVLGPLMLATGLGLGLRRHFPRRVVYPAVSLLLFAYYTLTLFLITEYDQETGNIFGPLRAIAMAGCVAVVVLYSERATRGAAWVLARFKALRPVARPATAYPLHKKFRTGMTLLMFAVILLMVSLFSIFGNLFLTEPERETGGYHVRGFSTQEVDALDGHGAGGDVTTEVVRVDVLPEFFKLGGDLVRVSGQQTGQFGPPRDAVWGIDEAFAVNNGFQLVFRHPDYETDEEAYRAVAARDDVVVVSYHYSTGEQGEDFAHEVGETLTLNARGATSQFTIIGVQQQFHFKGIFVREDVVGRLFTNTDTMLLFEIEDPAAAGDVAKQLEANYRDIGLDASDLRQDVLEEQEQFRRLLSMVQLFLGLGLVVGILSLGIVTARNVVERRQEIGMLRALGFRRAHVRRAFLLETIGTITLGVLIGAFVAILVSYGLWVALLQDLDVAFSIPWGELAAIAAVAYVATILATLAPIFRAARTPPAEALRYIE